MSAAQPALSAAASAAAKAAGASSSSSASNGKAGSAGRRNTGVAAVAEHAEASKRVVRASSSPSTRDDNDNDDAEATVLDRAIAPIGAAFLGATPAALRFASARFPPVAGRDDRPPPPQAGGAPAPTHDGPSGSGGSGGKRAHPGAPRAAADEAALAARDLRTVFDPATCASRGVATLPARAVPVRGGGLALKEKEKGRGKGSKGKGEGSKSGSGEANGAAAGHGDAETFDLYYEVHGWGPTRIAFVMGLNMSCFGWLPQVEYFMSRPAEYSVLVFDNRGYGNSGVPPGRYTTAQMALDLLGLLASPHVRWISTLPANAPADGVAYDDDADAGSEDAASGAAAKAAAAAKARAGVRPARQARVAADGSGDVLPADARALHLVGVSMGGMIALEFAKRYGALLRSLTLISTTSGRARGAAAASAASLGASGAGGAEAVKSFRTGLPPFAGVSTIARVMAGRLLGLDSDAYRIERFTNLLFPRAWLDAPSKTVARGLAALRAREGVREEDLPHGGGVREEDGRPVTNREWFADMFQWRYSYTHRQKIHGALAQIAATMTHRVLNAELAGDGAGAGASADGGVGAGINGTVPAIAVLTGDEDHLVNPGNSRHLLANMPRAHAAFLPGAGHALGMQCTDEVNALIQENVERGEKAVRSGGW